MKKITTIILSGTAVLFLSACGSSDSSSSSTPVAPVDPMTERESILIKYHYPAEYCSSGELKDYLERNVPGTTNLLLSVESNSVTCATYGRANDGVHCSEQDTVNSNADTSCVLGFDSICCIVIS